MIGNSRVGMRRIEPFWTNATDGKVKYEITGEHCEFDSRDQCKQYQKEFSDAGLELVFVVDESGSMSGVMGDLRSLVKDLAGEFADKVGKNVFLSLIGYDNDATIRIQETTNGNLVTLIEFNSEVDKLTAGGGTNTADGLVKARNLIEARMASINQQRKYIVVLLTDGVPNDQSAAVAEARKVRNIGAAQAGSGAADADAVVLIAIGWNSDSVKRSIEEYACYGAGPACIDERVF